MTTIDQLRALQSDVGRDLLQAIHEFDPQPNSGLAVISRLRKTFPADLVAAGMTVHLLRVRAREKFSRADSMWFTRDGLEQSTSEVISSWRAARFGASATLIDLCCGIGGDAIAFANRPSVNVSRSLRIVDKDPVQLEMAIANILINAPGAIVQAHLGAVEQVDLSDADALFIDPARRDDQGRHATGKSDPSLAWCIGLAAKVPNVGIKLAPGLPHHLIPEGWGFETVAIGGDLKEAVLWSPAMQTPSFRATVMSESGPVSLERLPGPDVGTRLPQVGHWLYDPNPAITRAGLVDDLARSLGAHKIDDQIGFLVAEHSIPTPFARRFHIRASLPWHERNLQQTITDLDGGEVVIRRRGLAGNVDDIQRRLRGSGPQSLFIAMTRLEDRPWAIVCTNRVPETGEISVIAP